jgi:hypothetical protein
LAEIRTEQGYQQGFQLGLELGRQVGARQGFLTGIEFGLGFRFGIDGLRLLPEINEIQDNDVLYALLESIKIAKNPDDVRRIYM